MERAIPEMPDVTRGEARPEVNVERDSESDPRSPQPPQIEEEASASTTLS